MTTAPLACRAALIASPSLPNTQPRAVIFHSGAESHPWTLYLPYAWPRVAGPSGKTSTGTYASHARAIKALEGVLARIAEQQGARTITVRDTTWERMQAEWAADKRGVMA